MNLPTLPDSLLDQFLADDAPFLDLTTHFLGLGGKTGRMSFAAREAMVLACAEEAARIVERAGATVILHAASGAALEPGSPILTATGSAATLLRAWKIAQNLIEVASGIATATRSIVSAARAVSPQIAITCTRKNAPGTKLLSLKAILAGGAMPHRLGLSETILIFAEHRAFLSGMSEKEMIALARRDAAEKKIVVEVGSLAEALAWGDAGADVIQAEKFPPQEIAALVAALEPRIPRPLIAAAGGVNAGNAAQYAAAGADILVTSAPYWGKPLDVAVRVEAA
ncbi:ModD protein [Methylocapsa aurea]|uniref:ModD protein n=1 Tax=Methylocapsa aurea TaxID=663610 RepID=UPI00056A5A74|nr:ModD protein [Methylocapsa aurea]